MTEPTHEEIAAEKSAVKHKAQQADSVSDPALNTKNGHDWSDEGGATEDGPATGTESAPGR